MKTFIIAVILFLLTVASIFFNLIYIYKTSDEFIGLTDALAGENASADGMATLKSKWDKEKELLSFSINKNDISKISSSIISAEVYFENNDIVQFKNSVALLRRMFIDMKRLERFDFDNIF